ncbi:MAG TPA: rod shape-determining protein MreD [Solirubrobacteraceae bacterium]|nr:rod shape-determining protein MreD [Solirubrobacteraceae bacterium]
MGDSEHPWRLPLRLALIGVLAVLLQAAVVSQISVFGVSADLGPLVVAAIGLLCGSLPGAVAGFGIGLFVDLTLVQTLGITSLLYIPIGYWAGRLRELRDPSHGLVPLGMGALATVVSGLGMTVIQFLLGVDSPVSGLLFQQIFMTVLINTLIALPVYHAVRRLLRGATPTGPRATRRAYTSGALSPLQQPSGRLRNPPARGSRAPGRGPARARMVR